MSLPPINPDFVPIPDTHRFDITVVVDGFEDYRVLVNAPREGLAHTRAMRHYPHPLRGQFVDYVVNSVTEIL
jgi:hypothetical protein